MGEELVKILAVGEIQPAAPRQKEFPPGGWHPLVDRDFRPAACCNLGRHQTGGTGAHDGNA